MCVIIHRLANVIIPPEKIAAACTVNADGFGLAIADRGRIELIKELNPQGNDPERILKLLEEAKDLPLLLHLRFKTVGDINEANCHPFVVSTHADDGTDIVMCHNGTMSQFNITGTSFSDSYMFNEMILKPMIERSLCSPDVDVDTVLQDEFIQLVLNEFVPSSSIVSLMDGNGATLHIHETNGFEHEGWWSSNNYSFNVTHRVKSAPTFSGYSSGVYGDGHGWPSQWELDDADQGLAKPSTAGADAYQAMQHGNYKPTLPTNFPVNYETTDADRNDGRKEEFAKIKDTMSQLKTHACPSNSMLRLATANRTTFVGMAGINNLKETCRLEREDIAELVHFYPEASIVLIQDLLLELYLRPHVSMTQAMDAAAKAREEDKNKKEVPTGTALVPLEEVFVPQVTGYESATAH